MAYRKEIISEIFNVHTVIFGRGPKIWETLFVKWQLRKWSDERLLGGLVVLNIELYNKKMRESL